MRTCDQSIRIRVGGKQSVPKQLCSAQQHLSQLTSVNYAVTLLHIFHTHPILHTSQKETVQRTFDMAVPRRIIINFDKETQTDADSSNWPEIRRRKVDANGMVDYLVPADQEACKLWKERIATGLCNKADIPSKIKIFLEFPRLNQL